MKLSNTGWRGLRSRKRCWRASCVFLVGFSIAAYSGADGGTTSKATDNSGDYRRLSDSARALPQLGGEVARLEIGEPSLVAVSRIIVPEELERVITTSGLEALRREIRQNVASTVPFAKIQTEEALSPSEARTRARQTGLPLVFLSSAIKSGDLFLEVTVTKWPSKFWRRVLAPEGTTTEALRLRVGAESLRGLFPVAKRFVRKRTTIKSPISAPVALACGDIDEDGHPDLAVIGRHSIVLGALSLESFREKTRRDWEDLSKVHGSPLRSPLAAARIENKLLTVGLSDRAQTVHLNEHLARVGYSARGYPLSGGQCLSYSAEGLMMPAINCQTPQKDPPARLALTPMDSDQALDAYASRSFLTESGVAGSITTQLPLGASDASVEVALPSEQLIELVLEGTGASIVNADINGDGTVEIISSSGSAPGAADHLRIHTVLDRRIVKVTEVATSSIFALAVCPFDGENPLTLVMATAEELWILK